jgi:hypothetical protein
MTAAQKAKAKKALILLEDHLKRTEERLEVSVGKSSHDEDHLRSCQMLSEVLMNLLGVENGDG